MNKQVVFLVLLVTGATMTQSAIPTHTLWYKGSAEKLSGNTVLRSWENESPDYRHKGNPDSAWHDYVLPIGNGHMGAGVFGDVTNVVLDFSPRISTRIDQNICGYRFTNIITNAYIVI